MAVKYSKEEQIVISLLLANAMQDLTTSYSHLVKLREVLDSEQDSEIRDACDYFIKFLSSDETKKITRAFLSTVQSFLVSGRDN